MATNVKPHSSLGPAPKYPSTKATAPTLDNIRAYVRNMRDLAAEAENYETLAKQKRGEFRKIEREILPEMFTQARITAITIDPEGNYPGFEAEATNHYHANIPVKWTEEQRAEAFDVLRKFGGESLIRTEITISLPKDSTKLVRDVLAALRKLKVTPSVEQSVPWKSLTSWLKEAYEKRKVYPPLDKIGGDAARIVKISPIKKD